MGGAVSSSPQVLLGCDPVDDPATSWALENHVTKEADVNNVLEAIFATNSEVLAAGVRILTFLDEAVGVDLQGSFVEDHDDVVVHLLDGNDLQLTFDASDGDFR